MARSTGNGAGGRGRWRKAVWGAAAFLWLLILAGIQVTDGLNLALTLAVSVILLIPTGIYELALALQTRSTVYRAAVIGAAVARFRPYRMAIALFATALAQLSVPVLALAIWQSQLSWGGAGMLGVFIMNAFFATLFVGSALLFRQAARERAEWGAA